MKPEATWLVVSDAERMKVYTFVEAQDGSKRFVQLEERVHPASTLKNSELVSSDQGHLKIMTTSPVSGITGTRSVGSKYQPKHEPHLLEAMSFAKEVADHLYVSHRNGKFKHLVLCAADHFCGLLRPELKPALLKATYIERKGYTKTPIKKLEEIALSLLNVKSPVKAVTARVNTAPAKEPVRRTKTKLITKAAAKTKAKTATKAKKVVTQAKSATKLLAKTKPAVKAKKAKTTK
jgi:protein required for attachment to host cells